MGLNFVSDWQACHERILHLLTSQSPVFIARIGGSDTDVVLHFWSVARELGKTQATESILPRVGLLKTFNGYYDLEEKPQNAASYCESMLDAYVKCDEIFFGHSKWLSEFFPNNLHPKFRITTDETRALHWSFLEEISARHVTVNCFPYTYVERVMLGEFTFFHALSKSLEGLRVLAITPFSKSIRANFQNRSSFFKNYSYPQFSLSTYNTPITYAGLPTQFYPHKHWLATAQAIQDNLEAIDFDIALMSCGSYAMPLGVFIRDVMKKKAVYVGGVLQLFFGIMGRRYCDPFFSQQINESMFIFPLERNQYSPYMAVATDAPKEAFGAYF
jgi:hypothetical protein